MENPIVQHCDAFSIYTAQAITTSCDDFDSANKQLVGKLHDYWSEFKNRDQNNKTELYIAYYTNYQPTTFHSYDFALGITNPLENTNFQKLIIPSARYIVFKAQSSSFANLVETWGAICTYFKTTSVHHRAFTLDFEIHTKNSIDIYIAIM